MEKREVPPELVPRQKHSPYTPEGQLEQYAALSGVRGWRRTFVKVVAWLVVVAIVFSLVNSLFLL